MSGSKQRQNRARTASWVIACGLAVAACGSDGQAAETTATGVATTAGSIATTTTGVPAAAACRNIEHQLGTSCVPADPLRIVALDPLTVLPTLLAIGAPVVATVSVYSSGEPFVDYLESSQTAELELVGSFDVQPNLELIAAAKPDLIIGSVSRLGEVYDQLTAIAPTVATGYAFYETNWRDEVELTADAAGRLDDARTLLAGLDAKIESTKQTLASLGGTRTLSRVDIYQTTPLYYRFDCVWFGGMMTTIGITQPSAQDGECTPGDPTTTIGYLSLETLDALDADAIVAYQQQSGPDDVGADPLDTLTQSPLWAELGAVQNDRVFVLGDAWGLGGSVQAAETMLDELVDVVFAGDLSAEEAR